MHRKMKEFFTPERKLLISVLFGWSIILQSVISSWVSMGQFMLSSLIFPLFILALRYTLVRPTEVGAKTFKGWSRLALFDFLIMRRGKRSGGGVLGFFLALTFGLLIAVIKGMFVAIYYLGKETYTLMTIRNEIVQRPTNQTTKSNVQQSKVSAKVIPINAKRRKSNVFSMNR